MTLRQDIAEAFKAANGNPEQAAIAICKLLDDKIDLAGNGWFDDDDEMLGLLSDEG
ncbi:TPA: hypothetical protein MM158_005227 [Klebsiella pneumoniae]|nr:hypothetical protein [Klebsiella pneumoniae]